MKFNFSLGNRKTAVILIAIAGAASIISFQNFESASSVVKWSKWSNDPTLNVVADGQTDNTEALNAIAVYASQNNVKIIGDCPGGQSIVLKSAWIWQSNMNISIDPGCTIQSTLDFKGSYAISQTDLTTPLSNITVDGLQISSPYKQARRIMEAYINNFTLTHWKVTQSGGIFFLRGSNQEIAYGTVTGTYPDAGNPGIRQIGNCLDGYCKHYRDENGDSRLCAQTPCPEVSTTGSKPANVYIHDNNLITGDGCYQACQPLDGTGPGAYWINVGSTDILYRNNSGHSDTALMLVGEDATPGETSSWSCSNITFDNVNENSADFADGKGSQWGVHIASKGPMNTYSNITIENSTIGNNSGTSGARPVLFVDAIAGGLVSNLKFRNVNIQNVNQVALATFGSVSNLTFDGGVIAAPNIPGSAVIILSEDTSSSNITNNNIVTKNSDGIQIGTDDDVTFVDQKNGGGQGPNVPSSNINISNNTITGIGNGYAGIRMANLNHGYIFHNTLSSEIRAKSSTGIYFSSDQNAGNTENSGTTYTTATRNTISTNIPISFASGQGNCATDNAGASNDCD